MSETDIEIGRVAKFGGTSMARPDLAAEKIDYPGNDAEVVVVSAPAGLTDALYEFAQKQRPTQEAVESIQARVAGMAAICDPSGTDESIQTVVGGVLADIHRWQQDGAPIMGLGEVWSARIFAAYTGREFVDARHVVRFNAKGLLDADATRSSALRELGNGGRYVVPGFSGADGEGRIHLLDRNGSDTSAALLAYVLRALRLDIWSDVPGYMSADPRVVPGAFLVPKVTNREAREMYPGCTLLHRDVIRFTGRAGIDVYMRNTLGKPDNVGTIVSRERDNTSEMPVVCTVGMDDLTDLGLYQFGTEERSDTMTDAFGILGNRDIPVEDVSSHVDGLSVIFQDRHLSKLPRYKGVLRGLDTSERRASIRPIRALRIVGEIFARRGDERTEVLSRAVSALAAAGTDVSGQTGSPNCVSRTFFIEDESTNQAVNAVHDKLLAT